MMFKKTKCISAMLVAAALIGTAGVSFSKAAAADEKLWLPSYLEADAVIDAKEQRSANEANEFFTRSEAYKTTDWAGTDPSFDENGAVLSYWGGVNVGSSPADTLVGSAVTVGENTTKLKIARAFSTGRYRYAYPVQLDGLEMLVNLSQIQPGESLRFTFGASYDNYAHPHLNSSNGLNGIVLEFHQDEGEGAMVRYAVRSLHNYGYNLKDAEFSQYAAYDEAFGVDAGDEGCMTMKISFAVEDTGKVALTFGSHRNHPLDTTPTRTVKFTPSAENSTLMQDANGDTWIGVNSYAEGLTEDGNNTDKYTRFAVQVNDANRKAYETGDLAAAKTALAAYNPTAVQDGTVTEENRSEWAAKKQALTDLLPKVRMSDRFLLQIDEKIEAADKALAEKLNQGLDSQINEQIEAYKNAPLTTLDEVYAAIDKRDAIGDYTGFENAEELSKTVSEKDADVVAAADGLLTERMAKVNGFVANGVNSYQESLFTEQLANSITDRDLLIGKSLQLEKLAEYQGAIADMLTAKEVFDKKMSDANLSFSDLNGKRENSVNDLAFVENGLQVSFTGDGRQLALGHTVDVEKGVRAIFSVDEWAYLSNIYNPNGMVFFISQRANASRGAGCLACMLFVYEDSVNVNTYYGKSNDYADIVNIKRIEADDGSYVSVSFKLNTTKNRYEISLEYLDKDGFVIDVATSYLAYKEADENIGGVSINADTYQKGAYFYMGSWMCVKDFKNPDGSLNPALTPDSLFNTITFKVFGDLVFDSEYAIDYIKGVSVKEGTMKSEYTVGESIDLTGATLLVTKESGATEEVEIKRSMVSGFNSKKAGTVTLKIVYETFETSFEITVTEEPDGPSDSSSASDSTSVSNGSSSDTASAGNSGCGSVMGIGMLALLPLAAAIVTMKNRKKD